MIGRWVVGLVHEIQIIYDKSTMIDGEGYGIAIFNRFVLGVGVSYVNSC